LLRALAMYSTTTTVARPAYGAGTPLKRKCEDGLPPAKRTRGTGLTPLLARRAKITYTSPLDQLRCSAAHVLPPAPAPATAPATCTSCAKTAPCAACAYCERPACEGCARRCEACDGLFCAVCSTVDYQARYERVVCLSCAEDAARNAGDAMDM
jgi:hypothetical protein